MNGCEAASHKAGSASKCITIAPPIDIIFAIINNKNDIDCVGRQSSCSRHSLSIRRHPESTDDGLAPFTRQADSFD